jgi:ABC-type sugar transport system ATPase subunit
MSVREQLAFALVIRGWPRRAIKERVAELAGLLGVVGLLERKPPGLSGGESQRVALGRALGLWPALALGSGLGPALGRLHGPAAGAALVP